MILKNKFGINSLKSFVEAELPKDENGDVLMTATGMAQTEKPLRFMDKRTGENFAWEYHTAPVVCVTHKGKLKLFSFDLSLFDGPVEHRTWINALTQNKGASYYGENYLTTMYNLGQADPAFPTSEMEFKELDKKMTLDVLSSDWAVHEGLMKAKTVKLNAPSQTATTVN